MTKTNTKNSLFAIFVMTSMLLLSPSMASNAYAETSNIVVNGSFEEPSISCLTFFVSLGFGSTAIAGWTVGGNGIDWICSGFWQATDGSRSLDLSGISAGSISQVIPTDAGNTYNVTFDMAGNPDGGNPIKLMTVTAADSSELFTFDTTGNSLANMGYEQNTFSFTATDASTTLTFTSNEDSGFGPVIDNISATLSVIAVTIDIKPGSDENPINTKSKGVIPVAILSTADFDVTDIDGSTVTFGPNGATESHSKVHFEDVNGDGLTDMVVHFKIQDTGIGKSSTEACITGTTYDETAIKGCDVIRTK